MEPFPHLYDVRAAGAPDAGVTVGSEGLPELRTDAPPEFGGPSGMWSPETLLVASAADCFVLTFRAIARASKLEWRRCECEAEGVLDRCDGVVRFTEIRLRARLVLPDGVDPARAQRLLEKAEKSCLITRSLAAHATLTADVIVADAAPSAGA